MKAILTFNLPKEQQEFDDALNGHQWKKILYDIDQSLRATIKYENTKEIYKKQLEIIRNDIREIMDDRNLSFD